MTIRSLARALAIPALGLAGLVAPLVAGGAKDQVVAVFPPWWEAARVVQAAYAAGPVLRLGPASFVIVIAPDGPHGRDRLRQSGAWLLFNANGLAGCFSRIETHDI